MTKIHRIINTSDAEAAFMDIHPEIDPNGNLDRILRTGLTNDFAHLILLGGEFLREDLRSNRDQFRSDFRCNPEDLDLLGYSTWSSYSPGALNCHYVTIHDLSLFEPGNGSPLWLLKERGSEIFWETPFLPTGELKRILYEVDFEDISEDQFKCLEVAQEAHEMSHVNDIKDGLLQDAKNDEQVLLTELVAHLQELDIDNISEVLSLQRSYNLLRALKLSFSDLMNNRRPVFEEFLEASLEDRYKIILNNRYIFSSVLMHDPKDFPFLVTGELNPEFLDSPDKIQSIIALAIENINSGGRKLAFNEAMLNNVRNKQRRIFQRDE